MTYRKFRGRGRGATEKIIGADGIVQIEVENKQTGEIISKGLLFQAKKVGASDARGLKEQVEKMEKLSPHGSAVFEYGPEEYRGIDSPAVIDEEGRLGRLQDEASARLGNYLADRFLPCEVGVRGLYYDAVRKTLFVPDDTEGVIQFRKRLGHRFRIEIQKLNT